MSSKQWQTHSSEEVYKTAWITVRRDEVTTPSGKPLTYSVVKLNHPSVYIVAANDKGELYMQRNFRYTIGKRMWEFPAGHSDGEEPLKAAKRELLEETGLASDDWHHLGRLYQATGIGDIPVEAFLAKNVRSRAQPSEEEEDISEHKFIPLKQIENMVRDGTIEEAPMVAVFYLAKLHGL